MLEATVENILLEVRRVINTEIENEYGAMQKPDIVRLVGYGAKSDGVLYITSIFEMKVGSVLISRNRMSTHMRYCVDRLTKEGAKMFAVEPVIRDAVLPEDNPLEPKYWVGMDADEPQAVYFTQGVAFASRCEFVDEFNSKGQRITTYKFVPGGLYKKDVYKKIAAYEPE